MVFNSKIDLPPNTVTLPFLPKTLFDVHLQKISFLGCLGVTRGLPRPTAGRHVAAGFFWNRILFASKVEKGSGEKGRKILFDKISHKISQEFLASYVLTMILLVTFEVAFLREACLSPNAGNPNRQWEIHHDCICIYYIYIDAFPMFHPLLCVFIGG